MGRALANERLFDGEHSGLSALFYPKYNGDRDSCGGARTERSRQGEILWREMVNSVADKFDEVADLSTERGESYRTKINEAFDSLKKIFYDLSW